MAFTQSFAFPNIFDVSTGRCVLKEDFASIANRVGLLLRAYKGEEFMFPEFGSRFPDILLQYQGQARISKAKEDVVAAITEYEPYVDSKMIDIADESDMNNLKLVITLVLDKNFREMVGTIEWSFDQEGVGL